MHNGLKLATTLWILIVTAITQGKFKENQVPSGFCKVTYSKVKSADRFC